MPGNWAVVKKWGNQRESCGCSCCVLAFPLLCSAFEIRSDRCRADWQFYWAEATLSPGHTRSLDRRVEDLPLESGLRR